MGEAAPPFRVDYVEPGALPAWPNLLGVIGYGAGRPAGLPAECVFAEAPLAAMPRPMLEVWRAAAPVRPVRLGPVEGSSNEEIAFGALVLDEADGIEHAACRAYEAIFDFLDRIGGFAPVRFWNYLTRIVEEEGGLERYRHFNIGRHRAFERRLHQALPPAATCVGGDFGQSILYFLATPWAAVPVENPRQLEAYRYPAAYGPRSPSFSRAARLERGGSSCLFVSGTASIVGHESLHAGQLRAQTDETAANLRAVIGAAGPAGGDAGWALKTYLHDAQDAPDPGPLADLFGADPQQIILKGDICRRDLLIEIEAFRQFD